MAKHINFTTGGPLDCAIIPKVFWMRGIPAQIFFDALL
jgi:hypothetical protein